MPHRRKRSLLATWKFTLIFNPVFRCSPTELSTFVDGLLVCRVSLTHMVDSLTNDTRNGFGWRFERNFPHFNELSATRTDSVLFEVGMPHRCKKIFISNMEIHFGFLTQFPLLSY
ncbi:hypothetical protein CEXT_457721 [Caerostris extrusa]|uniref:Secreted protein n=1 Tax=Caerostris extrusa TaxID=172846 RepID=A0AAV4XGQ8_CAEEX|nr:hypothetical protein CEXT_457721 [Caerostris extrusa]